MAASIENYRKQNLEQDRTPPELEQMKGRRRDGDDMYEHAGSQHQEAQETLLAT